MKHISRDIRDLLDQHAMNAVEIATSFIAQPTYDAWRERFWSTVGGDNGQTDLLCNMAFAMTRVEASVGINTPFWESEDLPLDWRDACDAFAAAVLEFTFAARRIPDVSDLDHMLACILTGAPTLLPTNESTNQ